MHHKTLVRHLISTLAVLAAGGAIAQQSVDWDAVQLRVHHVAGNIYYLEGQGGNIGLSIGEDGVVMIDDQFAPLTERIVRAIGEVSDGEIRFVINTHVHPDHTGGNENLGNMGVMILANDLVRLRLAKGLRGGPPAPDAALPMLTYSDTMTLHLNGEQVHAFTVPPAHTDGDSFIYFRESDVLHLGDVFRTNNFPYIDVENGGTLEGTLEALGLAIGMAGPDTLIIPGHGVVSTREDVMEFRDMTITIAERMSKLVAEGKNFDEVVAARPAADFEERWGDPMRFFSGLYPEVGGR